LQDFWKKRFINCNEINFRHNGESKNSEAKKGVSEAPSEIPQETTVSEPVQPEETQGVPRELLANSLNIKKTEIPLSREEDPRRQDTRLEDEEEADKYLNNT
jgi:hypothetical protein